MSNPANSSYIVCASATSSVFMFKVGPTQVMWTLENFPIWLVKVRRDSLKNYGFKYLLNFQEYEQQMKAYGIPVQSYVFKPASASVTSANGGSLIGTFVKAESITSNSGTSATLRTVTAIHTTGNSNGGGTNSREADSTHTASSVVSTVNVKQEMPDLEGCHLTSKQLEEFMDEDCHGPVTSGDPMLSSPHLTSVYSWPPSRLPFVPSPPGPADLQGEGTEPCTMAVVRVLWP